MDEHYPTDIFFERDGYKGAWHLEMQSLKPIAG